MCDNIKDAVNHFNRDRSCMERLKELLFEEIINATKGMRHSKFQIPYRIATTFKMVYKKPILKDKKTDISNDLPYYVEWNDIQKDFSKALLALFYELLSKIKNRHKGTLLAFNGDETDRKKWIRRTLGFVLNNEIFADEMKNSENAVVPLTQSRAGGEGEFETDLSDKEMAKEFWSDHHSELKDGVDIFKWQREAFFWKPGKTFQGKELKAQNGIYIAFFYAWLRRCSHATFSEIAGEVGLNSSPSRDWKPHTELEKPFPKVIGIIYPVYFSEASLESIGMTGTCQSKYRCHRKSYNDPEKYSPILHRKELLWRLYEFLKLAGSNHDFLKASYGEDPEEIFGDDDLPFSCEIKANDDSDISIHPEKHYLLLYIKSVEVNDAGNVPSDRQT